MRFVIYYRNREDVRQEVMRQIITLISQGVNFVDNPVQTQLFQTRAFFPDLATIHQIPLTYQVEEVEYNDKKEIISIRKLVIDVETC